MLRNLECTKPLEMNFMLLTKRDFRYSHLMYLPHSTVLGRYVWQHQKLLEIIMTKKPSVEYKKLDLSNLHRNSMLSWRLLTDLNGTMREKISWLCSLILKTLLNLPKSDSSKRELVIFTWSSEITTE